MLKGDFSNGITNVVVDGIILDLDKLLNLLNYLPTAASSSSSFDFMQLEQNIPANVSLKNIILKSASKYPDYRSISKCIYDDCINWIQGIWIIIVGEKNKFNDTTNSDKSLVCNESCYKIVIEHHPFL